MKVNHKTFKGGYAFKNFEGQASKVVSVFSPKSDLADLVYRPDKGVTAVDVLKALDLTSFIGPETALVSTEGTIDPAQVKDIIISAVEVEPYDLPNASLFDELSKTRFVDGLKAIRESYGKARIILAIGENQDELIQTFSGIADNVSWLNVYSITSKYPANLKELLVPTILDKKYPVGYAPAHIGALFLKVTDVLQVARVVSEAKPMDTVTFALAGPGWKENLVLQAPVGTKVKDITDSYLLDAEMRIIHNSVITGTIRTGEDVITFDTTALIALPEDKRRQTLYFLRAGKNSDSFSNTFISKLMPKAEKVATTSVQGERRACVSCTYCQNVCPVGLIPHLLHKHVDKEIYNKRLAEYKIFDCIECGLCDYVCPSKIEVSSDIKKGKIGLEKEGISHINYLLPNVDMILKSKEVSKDE